MATPTNIAHELHAMAEGLGDLLASHLRLARLELQDDAHWVGRRVGIIFALAPLLIVGYAFLCVAAVVGLERVIALPSALVIVGLLNVIGSLGGITLAANQLQRRELLSKTVVELETSSVAVVRSSARAS
jgi:uncharacterized membrane protein YqjE